MPVNLDVPYRTLWGWINESEENQLRYDEAREKHYQKIIVKIEKIDVRGLETTCYHLKQKNQKPRLRSI